MITMLAYLILLVVLLGAGMLVASILPTRGARIGLGAVLFLALVVDATWFAAPLVGWSPFLADLVWIGVFAAIALITGIVALYYYWNVSVIPQPAWTWPSARDGMFLALVILLFGMVVLLLPVPLDTDAQGFGYLSLTLRDGRDYTTLAPWHSEIEYLYSPGYIGLIAHLSARFDLNIATLQLVFSAIGATLFVWMAYDLGCELDGPRTGRGFMLAAVIGTGLFTAFLDSHYTALLALDFVLAFLTFVLRFLNSGRWSDALLAAICLAGVPLTQPDTTIALIIGYVPWLVFIVFSRPRPGFKAWGVIAIIIPLVALGIVAPWLNSIHDLLDSDIKSPFVVELSHWKTLTLMHGGLIVLLAAGGLLLGLRRRSPAQVLMIVWLVTIVDFSTLGLLEKALPHVMKPLLKYDYPFSLAWHGPIIPYTVLGGMALVWLADRLGGERFDRRLGQAAIPLIGLAAIGLFSEPLLDISKNTVHIYGAFSSSADVQAMRWLYDHTPANARVLNHPGPHEGDWVPVISERDTIYFRPQKFFRGTSAAEKTQDALRAFWKNPADPHNAKVLEDYHIQYVLVPQIFGNPDSFKDMLRWRHPVDEAAGYMQTPVSAAPYLRLVYNQDGAQVYEVIPADQR
jgi:hypothetical protein